MFPRIIVIIKQVYPSSFGECVRIKTQCPREHARASVVAATVVFVYRHPVSSLAWAPSLGDWDSSTSICPVVVRHHPQLVGRADQENRAFLPKDLMVAK